jgi:tRNA(Ile)-lysidine synthase
LMALGVAHGCLVTVYHVDHHIREGSSGEAAVVERAAEAVGAKFVALHVDCPKGPNLEARARLLRFGVLPKQVATGHTADDQAETMLLNLLRGSARDGLSGIRRDHRHPILGLRRAETLSYAQDLQVEIVVDPSNEDPTYLRNRVRHELLPLLGDIAGRDPVPILVRQSELLRDESILLDDLSSTIDPTDVKALRAAPIALARRALRGWLRESSPQGYFPDARVIERVLRVVSGEVLACEIAGGLRVRRSRGHLFVEPPE